MVIEFLVGSCSLGWLVMVMPLIFDWNAILARAVN
jgi:hypothetical protein